MTDHALPFAEAMATYLPAATLAELAEMQPMIWSEYDRACRYIEDRLAVLVAPPVQPSLGAVVIARNTSAAIQASACLLAASLTCAYFFFGTRPAA